MRFMNSSGHRRLRAVALGAAILLSTFVTNTVHAQFTGDPFDPYRNAYRSSSFPAYSNVGPLSGGYRYAAAPGVGFNTEGLGMGGGLGDSLYVGKFSLGLSGVAVDGRSNPPGLPPLGISGLSTPPTGAAGRRPTGFDRNYVPNAQGDPAYFEDLRAREELYFRALNEKDPAKKAALLRQYRDANRRVSLKLDTEKAQKERGGRDLLSGAEDAPALPGRPRQPRSTSPSAIAVAPPSAGESADIRTYTDMVRWGPFVDRLAFSAVNPTP